MPHPPVKSLGQPLIHRFPLQDNVHNKYSAVYLYCILQYILYLMYIAVYSLKRVILLMSISAPPPSWWYDWL